MILLTWIVPFIIGLLTSLTTNLDLVKICIVTHTSSKWPNFATAFLFFTTLVVIYVLYGMIIFKYWGLKRKMSAMRRKNRGNVQQSGDVEQKGKVIAKKAQKFLTFIKDSKYVISVISVFTVCWIPWILLVFYDIAFHELGSKEIQCGHSEASFHQNLTIQEEFLGQACVHGLMSGGLLQCEVPGDEAEVCKAVHEHLHDFLIICITRLCMCFSVLGSLINPILHGLCYPGFRQAVVYLKNR